MRLRQGLLGLVALGLVTAQATAQSVEQTSFIFRRPLPCDSCGMPVTGPVTTVPTEPGKTDQTPSPMLDAQAFAQAPAAGGEAGLSFNPAMFGDLGANGFAFINVPVVIRGGTVNTPTSTISTEGRRVPVVIHGSFKIADNESPRPTDRVFFTYNYYDRINTAGTGITQSVGLNREVFGFEKTFLDGDTSFGIRMPFLQSIGGSAFNGGFINNEIADLTFIGKVAFINDLETGNVLSGGLALTVPTADHTVVLTDGNTLRSVLFQPYVGWILNAGPVFAQAFHSLVVPTDSRDITEMNNDIGIGYWAYRNPDGFLRGIVPTLEGHLYTPLNHRNSNDLVSAPDIFTMTLGINFVLPGFSTIGAGVATPLTGPRPDNVEALVSINLRF